MQNLFTRPASEMAHASPVIWAEQSISGYVEKRIDASSVNFAKDEDEKSANYAIGIRI